MTLEKHPREDELREQIEFILKSNNYHILFIKGNPATGKSFLTRRILEKMGVEYIDIGDPTPEGLFEAGKEFSDLTGKFGVILIDETTLFFESKKNIRIWALLNQMGNTSGKRIVGRVTKTGIKKGEDETYEFRGKIIIIMNDYVSLPNVIAEATRSRSIVYEMNLTPIEQLKVIEISLKSQYGEDAEKIYKAYRKVLSLIAERIRPKEVIEIARSSQGVRLALKFADYYKIFGLRKAIEELVKEIVKSSQMYVDAINMRWGEFSAKYPMVSKRTWARMRQRVRDILSGIDRIEKEVRELIEEVTTEVESDATFKKDLKRGDANFKKGYKKGLKKDNGGIQTFSRSPKPSGGRKTLGGGR